MIIINKIELEETKWIGLALRTMTTNEMGRSGIDFYSLQPASDF